VRLLPITIRPRQSVGTSHSIFTVLSLFFSGYNNYHGQQTIIKRLEADGGFLARVKGSHHQFKHSAKPGLVTVKHPDSDIPAGTLNSIKKQAGWK